MTNKSRKTLASLKAKAKFFSKTRMPSLQAIHEMLDELKVNHRFYETQNVVEYRSGNNPYVNSRHDGKMGKEIKIYRLEDNKNLTHYDWQADSSNSYYSWNTSGLARDLVKLLKERKLV